MGNVNMPTAVAVAGGALCLLAGYLIGVVAGPDTTATSSAVVESFDRSSDELCLRGEAVVSVPGSEGDVLCGTWRHDDDVTVPKEGQEFRFVVMRSEGERDDELATFIYGDVVR